MKLHFKEKEKEAFLLVVDTDYLARKKI